MDRRKMERETVLAKIRATLDFSEETRVWLDNLPQDIWFRKDRSSLFFSEFKNTWEKTLIDTAQPVIQNYFRKLGLAENNLPQVKVYESYKGSWIVESALTIAGSVGSAYYILKAVSEIPEIVKGLSDLKDLMRKTFNTNANKAATNHLKNQGQRQRNLPPPPRQLLQTDFVIDARPLLSLTPAKMKSHKIHLNVAISKDILTIENLSDELMRDIKIGIFKGNVPKNVWTYQESYMGTVDILSPHQTIAKECEEFKNTYNEPLNLSGTSPLYNDCWVQDSSGIYLFNFYLED
jgi:hypothetical protein